MIVLFSLYFTLYNRSIAGYPMENLINTIAALNLLLKVRYVGGHLPDVINKLNDSTPLMFFSSSVDVTMTSTIINKFTKVRSVIMINVWSVD